METLLLGIYEFIYDTNTFLGVVGSGVGILVSLLFFAGGALAGKLLGAKVWRNIFLTIGVVAFLLVVAYTCCSSYVNEKYTKVPSIINADYREAKSQISEAGLICGELFYGMDDYRVVGQNPEPYAFVVKGSNVEVTLEKRVDAKGLANLQEEYANHEQVDVVIKVKELLGDVGGAKISRDITELNDIDVYLYEPKLDIYIRDCAVSGNEFRFTGIPEKVNYVLHVYLEGYEVYETTAYISEEKVNSASEACEFVAYMPIASAVTCSKSIQIENESKYDFDDLLVRFEFEGLDYTGDQFYVNSHGVVECELHYYEDLEMTVIVSTELEGGSEDGVCKVELKTYDVGYVAEGIQIRLNADGSCLVE